MTIHILYHGLPLCRFSLEMPAKWPEGHQWASLADRTEADCEACKALATQYFPEEPGRDAAR